MQVNPLVDTSRYALAYLRIESIGRKEKFPPTIRLPKEALPVVEDFMKSKPFGEMTGKFRWNMWTSNLELKEKIEGEDVGSNKQLISRHKWLLGLNAFLEKHHLVSILLNPSITIGRRRELLFMVSMKEMFLAPFDMEFHTHPKVRENMKFAELEPLFRDTELQEKQFATIQHLDVPTTYFVVQRPFPSSRDVINYVNYLKETPIAAVVSCIDGAGTILVPQGKRSSSKNILDLEKMHPFFGFRLFQRETLGTRNHLARVISNTPDRLDEFLNGDFKIGYRKAYTRIGDILGFVPYFADDYTQGFTRL